MEQAAMLWSKTWICQYWLWQLMLLFLVSSAQGLIEFKTTPKPQAALIGQDVRLDCVAIETNAYPLQYQWLFEGNSVEKVLPKTSMFHNNSLYVPQVSAADFGPYQCVVNVAGDTLSVISSPNATVVEAYIDDFWSHPEPIVTIDEGNSTTLLCITGRSAPPAAVHWLKNGLLFTPETHQMAAVVAFGEMGDGGALQWTMTLTLEGKQEVQGLYQCVATNPLTKQSVTSNSSEVIVNFTPRPPFVVQSPPVRVIVASSTPVTLTCGIYGWPRPDVLWYKDGDILQNVSVHISTSDDKLQFSEVTEEDVGNYSCNGSNYLGSVVSESTSVILASLGYTFVRSPSDVQAMAGQSAQLICRAPVSIPEADVIWYKNSNRLTERTGQFAVTVLDSGDLYFKNVQLEDEGEYFCVAMNNFVIPKTRTSATAKLSIVASPIFVQPLVATSVVKDRLLQLTCGVTGAPTPIVRWFFNDQELFVNDRLKFRNNKQELLMSNIRKSDEGVYKCVATNIHGSVSSPAITVTVLVPPVILKPVQNTAVTKEGQVMIKCAIYADPPAKITWYKDGKEVLMSGRFQLSGQSLNIRSVQRADEGRYTCQGTNSAGGISSAASLTVYVPPVLTYKPVDTIARRNQFVKLQCEATGIPSPVLSWMFNDSHQLPRDVMISGDQKMLSIRSVDFIHVGRYTCMASNIAGQFAQSALLSVQEKPIIQNITGSRVVRLGEHILLTCLTAGTPYPHVSWSLNGQPVQPSADVRITFPTRNAVQVKFAQRSDAGVYTCIAVNDAGQSSKAVNLSVQVPPAAPNLLKALPMSNKSVKLIWQLSNQDDISMAHKVVIQYKRREALEYDTYRDDMSAEQTSIEVDGLQPATDYLFRIAGRNAVGTGSFSAVLLAATFETAPSQPRNLEVIKVYADKVNLRWEVPQFTNGDIRMYQIQYKPLLTQQEFTSKDIHPPTFPAQHFTLLKLKPYTAYVLRVRAATIHRQVALWGDFTPSLLVNTSIKAPTRAPEDFSVSVSSSTKATVSWQMVLPAYRNGPITGHLVMYRPSDGTMAFQQVNVSMPNLSTQVTGLHPYTRYEFHVAAFNDAGRSPVSIAVSSKTQPAAPSGYPVSVILSAISSKDITVSWMGVAESEQNSQLSGYVVHFNKRESANVSQIHVNDASVMIVNISNLEPWTWYEVRVQAYTVQVPSGYGPLSPVHSVQTRGGVPGPVRDLKAAPGIFTARLSWLPPDPPGGQITHYSIEYEPLQMVTESLISYMSTSNSILEDTTPKSGSSSQTGTKQSTSDKQKLTTSALNVTVKNLSPLTTYRVSVVAVTAQYQGNQPEPTIFTTLGVNEPTTDASTASVSTDLSYTTELYNLNFTDFSEDDPVTGFQNYSIPRKDIPILVGALLTLLLVLIAVIVVILLYCRRKRKKNAEAIFYNNIAYNVIPPKSLSSQNSHSAQDSSDLSNPDRIEDHAPLQRRRDERLAYSITTNTASSYEPSSQFATSRDHMTSSQSATGQESNSMLGQHLSDYDVPSEYDSQLPTSDIDIIPYDEAVGIENPAYEYGASYPYKSEDGFSPNSNTDETPSEVSTLRRNRMKKNAAAAIAIQRDRNTSVFQNDTDMLINNESVVIYDERTVL